jgi:hypothetical protein
MAYTAGYELTEYFGAEPVVLDGKWTTADEWHGTTVQNLGSVANLGKFEYEMDSSSGTYLMSFLVEFADSTNDAGDVFQLCLNGGVDTTAPTAEDFKIEIQGHTTLKVYTGNGTGWTQTTTTAVTWANSLTTSPLDPANHWIAEFQVDKAVLADWGANPPPENVRVACYDASNPSQGFVSWPPTSSADSSSTWGVINNYSMGQAPEGLAVGVMLSLSVIAVIVSARYFRKSPKL